MHSSRMRTDRCSVRTGVVGELVICEQFDNRLPPFSPPIHIIPRTSDYDARAVRGAHTCVKVVISARRCACLREV